MISTRFHFQGAVPATIGIIKGQVHVGLSRDQLEDLASKKDPCFKTSRRDFPYVLSQVCMQAMIKAIKTNSLLPLFVMIRGSMEEPPYLEQC